MIKEIAIISGKGGTGKTTIAGSLAYLASNKIVVDCDVDAADLHLILNGHTAHTFNFMSGQKAEIDPKLCINCGNCVEHCRFEAIKVFYNNDNECKTIIDPYDCEGCGVCAEFCPENAIQMINHKSGQWFIAKTKYGMLLHAKLGVAEANSGRLVSLLRKSAQELALKNDNDLILIDGSPGIGCPVIATLTGVSYALIVTEPTVSAIHDMNRLIDLSEHFDVKIGLCINKFDLNNELAKTIEQLAITRKIPILAKVPFDLEMVKSQVKGIPFTEFSKNGTSKIITRMWLALCNTLSGSDMKVKQNNNKFTNIKDPY